MINKVWNKIISFAGESFYTKSGLEFKYVVKGNTIIPDRTNYPLSKNEVKKAYELMPLKGPGEINNVVRGPAYIWAILNDERILKK